VVSSGAQKPDADPSPPPTREDLERRKLQAEVRKLELDIGAMSRKAWDERLVKLTPLLSVIIAALTVIATVWQYHEQGVHQAELSRREAVKPLLDRQTELYMEASKVVARLAQAPTARERSAEDVRKFWELYNGPLIIVESRGVSGAMQRFGSCLGAEASCDRSTLEKASRALSTAILESIRDDSRMTPAQFAESRHHYQP
jgi:hypothetical protein